MTYRISKGDMTVTADTEAELRIAVAMFNERGSAPAWAVGGPRDVTPIGRAYLGEAMQPDIPYGITTEAGERPKLVAVPNTDKQLYDSMSESAKALFDALTPPDEHPYSAAVQHITVSRRNREVLDAVMLFPEGVSTSSLATLLGIKQGVIAGRVQALKDVSLIEKVQGHRLWAATTLARRSKLVTG